MGLGTEAAQAPALLHALSSGSEGWRCHSGVPFCFALGVKRPWLSSELLLRAQPAHPCRTSFSYPGEFSQGLALSEGCRRTPNRVGLPRSLSAGLCPEALLQFRCQWKQLGVRLSKPAKKAMPKGCRRHPSPAGLPWPSTQPA